MLAPMTPKKNRKSPKDGLLGKAMRHAFDDWEDRQRGQSPSEKKVPEVGFEPTIPVKRQRL